MKYILVLVTAKDTVQAENISRVLLQKRLAACCSIVKDVRSLYLWQGKLEDSREVLLLIKTRQALFKALERAVKAAHSYTTPEIIALPVAAASPQYLKWIRDSTVAPGKTAA
jgi:periplasmic divalent cation tolerance protein